MYRLTVTASMDRDPSCNTFTLTQSLDFEGIPTPADVKQFCTEVKANFIAAYPHRQGVPSMILPLDATIDRLDIEPVTELRPVAS